MLSVQCKFSESTDCILPLVFYFDQNMNRRFTTGLYTIKKKYNQTSVVFMDVLEKYVFYLLKLVMVVCIYLCCAGTMGFCIMHTHTTHVTLVCLYDE